MRLQEARAAGSGNERRDTAEGVSDPWNAMGEDQAETMDQVMCDCGAPDCPRCGPLMGERCSVCERYGCDDAEHAAEMDRRERAWRKAYEIQDQQP